MPRENVHFFFSTLAIVLLVENFAPNVGCEAPNAEAIGRLEDLVKVLVQDSKASKRKINALEAQLDIVSEKANALEELNQVLVKKVEELERERSQLHDDAGSYYFTVSQKFQRNNRSDQGLHKVFEMVATVFRG